MCIRNHNLNQWQFSEFRLELNEKTVVRLPARFGVVVVLAELDVYFSNREHGLKHLSDPLNLHVPRDVGADVATPKHLERSAVCVAANFLHLNVMVMIVMVMMRRIITRMFTQQKQKRYTIKSA